MPSLLGSHIKKSDKNDSWVATRYTTHLFQSRQHIAHRRLLGRASLPKTHDVRAVLLIRLSSYTKSNEKQSTVLWSAFQLSRVAAQISKKRTTVHSDLLIPTTEKGERRKWMTKNDAMTSSVPFIQQQSIINQPSILLLTISPPQNNSLSDQTTPDLEHTTNLPHRRWLRIHGCLRAQYLLRFPIRATVLQFSGSVATTVWGKSKPIQQNQH